MGNMIYSNDIEMLKQLKKWLSDGEIFDAHYDYPAMIFSYIVKSEKTTFYREIDFDENRLFSCSLRLDNGKLSQFDKDTILTIPPTLQIEEALKYMGYW